MRALSARVCSSENIKAQEESAQSSKKEPRKQKEIFGAPRINEDAEAEAEAEILQKEDETKEHFVNSAADERAKAIEDGSVSVGTDLWVSQEDGS